MTLTQRAADVWRDDNVKGVPSSGKHHPSKSEIRGWARDLEDVLTALAIAGQFQGKWDADTGAFPVGALKGYSWIVGTPGTVNGRFFNEGDCIVALVNGASTSIYLNNWVVIPAGVSGVTAAVDLGEGAANAIRVKTEVGGGVREGSLLAFTLYRNATAAPVTVAVDGGAALKILSNSGDETAALTAGMLIVGQVRSTVLRLLNDADAAVLVAQAQAQADRAESEADRASADANRAENARDIAGNYASDAVSQGNVPIYATMSGMSLIEVPAGIKIIRVNGGASANDGLGNTFSDEAGEQSWRKSFTTGGNTVRDWYEVGDIKLPSTVKVPDDYPSLVELWSYLRKRRVFAKLTVVIGAGTFTYNQPIDLSHPDAGQITIVGQAPTELTINASSTPRVEAVAMSVSGQSGRHYYDVTLDVEDASGFASGDWVMVDVTGAPLSAATRNLTVESVRAWELSGAHEVVDVDGNAITVRNRSRTDSAHFPRGSAIKVVSGTIRKLSSVTKFSGSANLVANGPSPLMQNLAIVHVSGGDSGNSLNGVHVDTRANTGVASGSVRLQTVIISGFGGVGAAVYGPEASITGHQVYISDTGSHGTAAYFGARGNFTLSVASGCGSPSGVGFMGTQGGVMTAPGCRAFHVRDAGFLSNRGGTTNCRESMSSGNGNETDFLANGDGVLTEGKGYEAESASTMEATGGVALFNLLYSYYNNTGSHMFAEQCLGGGFVRGNGANFLQRGAGCLSAGLSTALGIGPSIGSNRGFYANGGEINARDSWSQDHQYDYAAQAGARISVHNYTNNNSSFAPALNYLGGSGSLITNRATFDAGLDLRNASLTRGDVTISGGAITRTRNYHSVDTEGGSAEDDLTTVNSGSDGDFLILKNVSVTRAVTVKHGVGNIRLNNGADRVLNNPRDMLFLFYVGSISSWCEIAFSSNN